MKLSVVQDASNVNKFFPKESCKFTTAYFKAIGKETMSIEELSQFLEEAKEVKFSEHKSPANSKLRIEPVTGCLMWWNKKDSRYHGLAVGGNRKYFSGTGYIGRTSEELIDRFLRNAPSQKAENLDEKNNLALSAPKAITDADEAFVAMMKKLREAESK